MTNMKPEQQRISTLLLDTVTLLCRNGLTYKNKLTVQGLIGITIDDSEVFIVHINENTVEKHSNNYNEEHSKAPVQAAETVINTQFTTSGDTTIKPNKRVEKIHSNLNASAVTYNQSMSEVSSENGDVINIKSEGEEEEPESSFKQSITHCSSASLSDDLLFQQMLSTNYSTYHKQEMNDSEGRTDGGTFETVQQKMEINYDFGITSNYQTFSSNDGQDLKDFDDGNQLDYQAISEGYAEEEEEEVHEDDVKPDPNIPLASFSSWEQQHVQYASSHNHFSNRRSAVYSHKKANKRLKTNASSSRFSQCGLADSGQRFPHHRHLATNEYFPKKAAESSALNADETIKTMTTFICNIDGCTSSFTLKSNLLRHQTNKHGRFKKQRRTLKDMADMPLGYEQCDVTEDD